MKNLPIQPLALFLLAIWGAQAFAQARPDAGRVLQETTPSPALQPTPQRDLKLTPPVDAAILAGGATVTLSAVRITGNTAFAEAQLLTVLGEVAGKRFDLAGLKALANRIADHYQQAGYPFARVVIPAQQVADGVLTLQVIEGRYGKVEASGDARAQAWLADIEPGTLISGAALERSLLLLADQPGVQLTPILRPGQEVGTADLLAEVRLQRSIHGQAGADNHGNRYTGAVRLSGDLFIDSPFTLGDQISLRALYTQEDTWQGQATYSLPLGTSGLRGSIGYAHTYYELGKDFANLDAHGTADVASVGLSYPLLRSQEANLALGLQYQHKRLEDRLDAVATRNDKRSDVLPITLQFDRRNTWGVTWGALAYTAGRLSLDAALDAQDRASRMDSRGHFDKWNLDLAHLQRTPLPSLNLLGRLSAQWASKNLDSSESFLLGGPNGVRAYPVGEGNGDEGWLIQLEARLSVGDFEPFLFHDAGKVRINADNGRLVTPLADNTRSIAGSGLGLRWQRGPWSADAVLAWRNRGGKPQTDTRDDNPRGWINLSWRF